MTDELNEFTTSDGYKYLAKRVKRRQLPKEQIYAAKIFTVKLTALVIFLWALMIAFIAWKVGF